MSIKKNVDLTDEEYLNLFKISENKYLIGIYQDGITVYKQQIRALNIFHALMETKRLRVDKNFKICIIGGGVAGLTFAAAALKAGIKVTILEKHSQYLHMQYGCDIRRIHPNIYEWPSPNSSFPYARLPVLSWKHDTASNVAKQILAEFDKVRKSAKKGWLTEYTECADIQTIAPEEEDGEEKISIAFMTENKALNSFYNILIFAIGYGIERDVTIDGTAPSYYWRNDALDQSFLKSPATPFIISGDGDGGLIDLFRLKIVDFSYAKILNIIQGHKNYPKLKKKLLEIKSKAVGKSIKDNFVHVEFSKIDGQLYEYIHSELQARKMFRNNKVILNGKKKDFYHALDFRRVSLLNAFLAFILQENKRFEYKSGELKTIQKDPKYSNYPAVIRHGTNRENVFEGIPLTAEELQSVVKIKQRQQANSNHGLVKQRYKIGDINAYFIQTEKQIEYFTPDTNTLCSFFVNMIYGALKYRNKGKQFRVALHRVINLDNELHYQQITPYFPSQKPGGLGGIGQVFPVRRGSVGASIRSGASLLVVNENAKELKKLVLKLNLNPDQIILKNIQSALSIPILAPITSSAKINNCSTNLVLFLDSTDKNFFTAEVIDFVMSSLSGFIQAIENLMEMGKISMGDVEFSPLKIGKTPEILSFRDIVYYDLSRDNPKIARKYPSLKFRNFYSFDVIYTNFSTFFDTGNR